jgi:hypothetical protein
MSLEQFPTMFQQALSQGYLEREYVPQYAPPQKPWFDRLVSKIRAVILHFGELAKHGR